MENTNYSIRDLRQYHAWQSQTALRILYEEYSGVESRNLVHLYVALTLKVTYERFQNEFTTTNKEICEYTGLNHDSVPKLLRILTAEGLIKTEIVRDPKGFVLGKNISLLDITGRAVADTPKSGSSFLGQLNNYTTYNKNKVLSNDNTVKNNKVSYDTYKPSATQSGKKPRIEAEIYDTFSDIIDYAADNKILSRPNIVEEGDFYTVPKYIKSAIQKLIRLQNGTYSTYYKADLKNFNVNNWREEIYRALDNLKIMKEDGRVWPVNKSTLPKNLDTFLYNDRTNFSFFIKCLEEIVTQKETRVDEKYGDTVKEEYIAVFDKWFKDLFYTPTYEGRVNMKRNIGELLIEHTRLWETYGQYYSKVGEWYQYLGGSDPMKFIEFYVNYLREKNFSARESCIRPDSSAFSSFINYLLKEYSIDTMMDEKEHARLVERATPKKKTVIKSSEIPENLLDLSLDVLTGEDLQNYGK